MSFAAVVVMEIVLSDGKPCDMSIQRPGTRQPKIYDGEKAVKDTAYEVRRARNQGIFVIGIFAGNEEELSVEKRIYGKDFAYIRNITWYSQFAIGRQFAMNPFL